MDQKGQAFTSGTKGFKALFCIRIRTSAQDCENNNQSIQKSWDNPGISFFVSWAEGCGGFPITTTKRGTFFFPFPVPPFLFLPLAYTKGARTSYHWGYSKTERKFRTSKLSHNWDKRPERSKAEQSSKHACTQENSIPPSRHTETLTRVRVFFFFSCFVFESNVEFSYSCFFSLFSLLS